MAASMRTDMNTFSTELRTTYTSKCELSSQLAVPRQRHFSLVRVVDDRPRIGLRAIAEQCRLVLRGTLLRFPRSVCRLP